MTKCQCLSVHADIEKASLWQIEPLCVNNVEKKNGRDRAGGKADSAGRKYKIETEQFAGSKVQGEKKKKKKHNCKKHVNIFNAEP